MAARERRSGWCRRGTAKATGAPDGEDQASRAVNRRRTPTADLLTTPTRSLPKRPFRERPETESGRREARHRSEGRLSENTRDDAWTAKTPQTLALQRETPASSAGVRR